MSKVFNMVGGGGGGKSISSIVITGLSSTDAVTCTKDGKSYTATWDETAQYWEIVDLPLGTFTLTATNGTKTTTETVLIDIAGVYKIEMDFKLWLYKDGNESENYTGGWIARGIYYANSMISPATPEMVKNKDNIFTRLANGKNQSGVIVTNNKIDVSNFSKLYFETSCDVQNAYTIPGFNLFASFDPYQIKAVDIASSTEALIHKISEMDISGYQGEYYVGLLICASADVGSPAYTSATIHRVWLE